MIEYLFIMGIPVAAGTAFILLVLHEIGSHARRRRPRRRRR